jgi:hypothetical protein
MIVQTRSAQWDSPAAADCVLWARAANGWRALYSGTAEACCRVEESGHTIGRRVGAPCMTAVLPAGVMPEDC